MSIPILSSRFFRKHRPDLGFFTKYQSLFPWNEKIIPVYEWNGILYVGCLQPPNKFPQTSMKIVYVLCEPSILQELWFEFQGASDTQEAKPPPPGAISAYLSSEPAGAPLSTPFDSPAAAEEEDSTIDFGKLELGDSAVSEDSQTETAPVSEEALDFSNLELEESTTPLAELSSELPLENPEEAPAKNDDFMDLSGAAIQALQDEPEAAKSDGLIELVDVDDESTKKTEDAELLSSDDEKLDLGGDLDLGAAFEASESKEESTVPAAEESELLQLDLNTNPAVQKPAASPVSLKPLGDSPLKLEKTEPKAEIEDTPEPDMKALEHTKTASKAVNFPPIPGAPAASATKKPDGLTKTGTASMELTNTSLNAGRAQSIVDGLFDEMSRSFHKTMILLKDGDQIKPWKWGGKFKKPETMLASYTLAQPSPFRIVLRTQQPYHGYVVSNDINEKFFAQWNDSQMPEHLTIAPVVVDDHLVGMLLGIGPKESNTKAALHLAENLAQKFAKQVKEKPNTLKAA